MQIIIRLLWKERQGRRSFATQRPWRDYKPAANGEMMVLIKTKDGKKALLNTKATSIREYEEEGEEPPTYGLCTLTIPAHAYFCLYRWSMSLSSLFRMFTNKGVHKGTVSFF